MIATSPSLPRSFPFHILLQAGEADGAGGLGDGAGVLEDVLDRRTDLVGADGDHLVEQLAAQAEGLLAGLAHGDPIGEQPDLVEDDALAGRERRRHAGGVVRLDADHLHLGPQELGIDGDARGEPAAPDRHEHRLERIGMLAQDLHADGALPGDDVGIVIGVDEGQALLGLKLAGVGIGLVEALAMQDDAATPAFHRLHLDGRCGARHHDGCLGAEPLSRQGHALRVIAGRGADHAPLERLAWQADHLVVGAAQLEREDRLQILALEPDGAAEPLRQARHRIERALDRDVVDAGGEDLADVVLHVSDAFLVQQGGARAPLCFLYSLSQAGHGLGNLLCPC